MREMVSLIAINFRQGDVKKDLKDPVKLSINELRAQLYDKGDDIDGPRKRLNDQLAEYKPSKKKLKPQKSSTKIDLGSIGVSFGLASPSVCLLLQRLCNVTTVPVSSW